MSPLFVVGVIGPLRDDYSAPFFPAIHYVVLSFLSVADSASASMGLEMIEIIDGL